MSTCSRFRKLLDLGPRVKCIRTGLWFNMSETNDYKGQRISKDYDYLLHEELIDQSKFRRGMGWRRGEVKGL